MHETENYARALTRPAATASGGAISLRSVIRDRNTNDCGPELDSPISLVIQRSVFYRNSASVELNPSVIVGGIASGGAISINIDVPFSRFEIIHCYFSNNVVVADNGAEIGGLADGSAIATSFYGDIIPSVSIRSSSFSGGTSRLRGTVGVLGGTSSGAASFHGSYNFHLHDVTMTDNSATSEGGICTGGALALRWEKRRDDQPMALSISQSLFENNKATGVTASAGALFVDHIFSNLTIVNTKFSGNVAKSLKCTLEIGPDRLVHSLFISLHCRL